MPQTTIAGKTFDIADKYSEGDTLNAAEASALNQTRRENIRNNFAANVKTALEDGTSDEALAAAVAEYAEGYEFGVRTGGGGSRDPVQTEAMSLAREAIKASLKAAGRNISDVDPKSITAKAKELVETRPIYLERAKERVAQMQAVAASDDDLLAGLTEKAPEAPQGEPTANVAPGSGEESGSAGSSRRRAPASAE